ncbi:GAF sensor signal transduction histidine kinase [Anaeromyxobacter sp. K]|uniref:GAF domain-containing sensor histidine kinase n=1 Tax=Anaeromyxobacter sp. (strain K) TaxID=447217 RepID=UPI00015F9A8F|nr:GAF domain-containing sensor histidine kinase [Anaeromyxobacter sp. K]ACG73905.1 GAF sensor signal transduction histidine kinase [Anaeromyxobacter sp. K]
MDATQPLSGAPDAAAQAAADLDARAQLEETQRRIAFLYEVTGALFEDARGHRATLGKLARLVVPHLADWCLVHLVRDDQAERVAAEHWNPDLAPLSSTLPRTVPLAGPAAQGLAAVVASGRAELVPDPPPTHPAEPADLAALRRLRARSWMIVPLRVRGRTRAVMTLAFAESTRRYSGHDLALAEDLAARAAMALENALLFEEVERAVRAREDTLSIVSHDLKNPMSALLLGIQRLARLVDEPRRPQGDALLAKLERTVRGMNRLIEGLLDLARIEAGRLQLDRRPEPPAAVVARATEPLEALAAERRQRIAVRLAPDLPVPAWDPDRMAQVIANLVGNALKFGPDGEEVVITAERYGGGLRFGVVDRGPGIAPEIREHLFDRYWQPAGDQKRGHGLGLFIVRGIVEAHGGQAWVESEPGRGAAFYFVIPT